MRQTRASILANFEGEWLVASGASTFRRLAWEGAKQDVQALAEVMLVVLLLCQILWHLENQDRVVFRKPARVRSQVRVLFCVILIPTFVPIYYGVLILSDDKILIVILHLRRDFLFNHTTYPGWLQRNQRGDGTYGLLLLQGGLRHIWQNFLPIGVSLLFHRKTFMEMLCVRWTKLWMSHLIPE